MEFPFHLGLKNNWYKISKMLKSVKLLMEKLPKLLYRDICKSQYTIKPIKKPIK